MILAGRRINDGMAKFVAGRAVAMLQAAGKPVAGARINLLGLTFKENVADLRNSKVAELHAELAAAGAELHVHDPRADAGAALREYGIRLERWEELPRADALVLAVAHREYKARTAQDFLDKVAPGGCVLDIKGALDLESLTKAGFSCWRL